MAMHLISKLTCLALLGVVSCHGRIALAQSVELNTLDLIDVLAASYPMWTGELERRLSLPMPLARNVPGQEPYSFAASVAIPLFDGEIRQIAFSAQLLDDSAPVLSIALTPARGCVERGQLQRHFGRLHSVDSAAVRPPGGVELVEVPFARGRLVLALDAQGRCLAGFALQARAEQSQATPAEVPMAPTGLDPRRLIGQNAGQALAAFGASLAETRRVAHPYGKLKALLFARRIGGRGKDICMTLQTGDSLFSLASQWPDAVILATPVRGFIIRDRINRKEQQEYGGGDRISCL